MITTCVKRLKFIPISVKIYPTEIHWYDRFKIISFISCKYKHTGFINILKNSLVIDLTKNEDELLQDMKSNTRNEIRRGIKENMTFQHVSNIENFLSFYNNFAKSKRLNIITKKDLLKYKDNLVLTEAIYNGVTIAMHAHIMDEQIKTIRLLYSASQRLQENSDKKYIGIGNRFLHFAEFKEFKKQGYINYDFAGIELNESNTEEYGIAKFKLGFGGSITKVYFVYSILFYILLIIKKVINK